MIVVLDTNVVVSGMKTPAGVCAAILDEWGLGTFDVCVSASIVEEYSDVLHRPHLKIPIEKVKALLSSIERIALIVDENSPKVGLPDPDDEIFLATALVAGAAYLVTGNLRHFPPRLCTGVRVVAPAEFLRLLNA